jgi:hypothetical protein
MSYARVCQCGCSRKLLKPNGEPDLRRRFFEPSCKVQDKRERVKQKRARTLQRPNLAFEGAPLAASTVGEFARELRRLGHSVHFLHVGRPAKAKSATQGKQ